MSVLLTIDDVQSRLAMLLQEAGCSAYTAEDVRADAGECWRYTRDDTIAHGGTGDEAFFEYIAIENAAVFLFFEPSVGIYVLRGDESAFQSSFDSLAMLEVAEAKSILATEFGKPAPDLVLEPLLSDEWLAKGDGEQAAP